MRPRNPKLERVRFRELDPRAREVLLTMLAALPVGDEPASPSSGPSRPSRPAPRSDVGGSPTGPDNRGDADWVLDEFGRLLARAEPLVSPLSSYLVSRQGDRLLLVQLQAGTPADPAGLPDRRERGLAFVRRVGDIAYRVLPVP